MLNHTSGLLNYGDLIPPGTTTPLTDQDVLHLIEQQGFYTPGALLAFLLTS